jgi:hypothetical protein
MSLPYVDVKKDNADNIDNKDETNLNNNSNNLNDNNNSDINSDKNKNMIEQNQNLLKSESNFNNNNTNNNNILFKDNITEPFSNMKCHLNNINNLNNTNNLNNNIRINPPITANSLLHSLSNANKFRINGINNKILVSNFNTVNNNKTDINNTNIRNNTLNNNLLLNQIQTPSQTSLFNQQKPPILDSNMFDKNNNSRFFEGEDEVLKQILKNSNDNGYIRSSLSFDTPKFPFGMLLSNNNFGNMKNNNYINSGVNNDMNSKKNKNNDVLFKPLNIICNKSVVRNFINNQNFICNNCEINKPNNN